MDGGYEYSARERFWLWVLAVFAFLVINGAFLYGLLSRPDALAETMTNPIAAAFMLEAFTSIWYSMQQFIDDRVKDGRWVEAAATIYNSESTGNCAATLEFPDIPRTFSDLAAFLELSRQATNCETLALDGIVYRHQVVSGEVELDVQWSNPSKQEHPLQCGFVSDYREISRQAGFTL